MPILALTNENQGRERRCALVPNDIKHLTSKGFQVQFTAGSGAASGYLDAEYIEAGASVKKTNEAALKGADLVARLHPLSDEELAGCKEDLIYVGFIDPFRSTDEFVRLLGTSRSVVSMDMVPRISRAQRMDALSSQASLAGYSAVLLAMSELPKAMPMMMTAAGTIQAAKVFVIGAGVAGLQAIATAKRMGARVEAFDTRAEVEDQVKSLGAKFIKVDLGETKDASGGYAGKLSDEQLALQRKTLNDVCARSDILITSAQVFGHKAPIVVTKEMIQSMKPGSLIVDFAVETGGNVEGSKRDEEVVINGVRILGPSYLAADVSASASQVYSANVRNILDEVWDNDSSAFVASQGNEVVEGCVIGIAGKVVNERVKAKIADS